MKIVALSLIIMMLVSLVIYLIKTHPKRNIQEPEEIIPIVKKKRVYKKKIKKV